MSQADQIRQFALQRIVAPARAAGRTEIIIRAGDLHKAMDLVSAMPAVCSAIGGNKFEQLADVKQLGRTGPVNGSNVYFNFILGPRSVAATPAIVAAQFAQSPRQKSLSHDLSLDLRNALVLVSCVKSKRPHAAPARDFYISAWFVKTRDLVEAHHARWFVLSSRYGLVAPETLIDPYDYTLNSLGVGERQAWARKVLEQLVPQLGQTRRIVMFGGWRYREFLVQPLERLGITVEAPLEHLRRGEQLAWLNESQ